MENKIKKYKIEDCKSGMIGHWIWLMIGALKNVKEFEKKKIDVCFDDEDFSDFQKETFDLLKNRLNVVPKDQNFILVPSIKARTSLTKYFLKINYEFLKNITFFLKLIVKKIFYNDDAFIEKKYFLFLKNLFINEIKDMELNGFEKIFVSRTGSEKIKGNYADGVIKRRQIENETEVAELAKKLGFRVIKMEDYSIKDKIRIFFNAKIIFGANGGGMTFLFMSKPGTKYIEIVSKNNHQEINQYKQISKIFKINFFRFDDVKKIDEYDNVIVDINNLENFLKKIL